MAGNLVSSVAQVKELVTRIEQSAPRYPFLFIDLEGANVSRHGSVAIMRILVGPERTVHLIDVLRLQGQAFNTTSDSGLSLREILESEQYPKFFFDVRMDSDALHGLFSIRLRCVVDLQLMEFATRQGRGQFLVGLSKCIEKDLSVTPQEAAHMKRVKEVGKAHFSTENGGRYEVFNGRPLSSILIQYCIQDLQLFPRLLLRYAERLQRVQAIQVQNETNIRIQRSQAIAPIRKGKEMANAPTFPPVQTVIGQQIYLTHPLNIICSSDCSTYCEPPDTFDPFSNPYVTAPTRPSIVQNPLGHSRHISIHGPVQPPSEVASALPSRRLSHPVLMSNTGQDRSLGTSRFLSGFNTTPVARTLMTTATVPTFQFPLAPTSGFGTIVTSTPPPPPPTSTRPAAFDLPFLSYPTSTAPQPIASHYTTDHGSNNLEMEGHYGSLSFLDEDDYR